MYQFEETDRLWIRKAKKGDAHAFACLYGKIYRDLYRFALGMMKHPQDAEDAVSEAVLSAFRYMSGLKKDEAFGSWMFRILSNVCKKHLLERQKHQDYSVHRNERDTAGCTDGSGASAGKEGNGDSDVAGNLNAERISEIQKNAEIPENAEKGKVGTAVKGRRGQMDPRPIGSDPDVVPGPEETVLKYQEVREAYLQLTEEERLIVGLSVFGGYNSKEIGESLTLNPATVRSKRSRALEKMRKSLEKEK